MRVRVRSQWSHPHTGHGPWAAAATECVKGIRTRKRASKLSLPGVATQGHIARLHDGLLESQVGSGRCMHVLQLAVICNHIMK